MNNLSDASINKSVLQQKYDDRYAGEYMDTDAYSSWAHGGLAGYRVRQTLAQVHGHPLKILDYGCGQGKWTPLLRDMYPSAEIVGVDISEVAIFKAAKKFPENKFLAFDGERVPLDDGSFDLVFSFHVLEHVLDVTSSIKDIARLLRPGGSACIIFPCGNPGSFEDRLVNLMEGGRKVSATGESIFFFEMEDGHVRRMTSDETIALFRQQGLAIQVEFYSGHFFAAFDWLVRGTGPAYINRFFGSCKPINSFAKIKLVAMQRFLLFLNRFLGYKGLDLAKRRPAPKQTVVLVTQKIANFVDRSIMQLARWEWDHKRHKKMDQPSIWCL